MRRNKEQRAARELEWQKMNDMPGTACEGVSIFGMVVAWSNVHVKILAKNIATISNQ